MVLVGSVDSNGYLTYEVAPGGLYERMMSPEKVITQQVIPEEVIPRSYATESYP